MKDISGVYSVTWKDQVIDGVPVSIAKINDTSYVAHWKVENSLVDDSAHYFVK